MSKFKENRVPDDEQHVVEYLREQRPEASALELDQIKLQVKARAKGAPTLVSSGKGRLMRSRIVSVMLAVGVLAGGTGAAAVTGTGGFWRVGPSPNANPHSQYCPPKSKQPGKPKKPRPARCGKGPKP